MNLQTWCGAGVVAVLRGVSRCVAIAGGSTWAAGGLALFAFSSWVASAADASPRVKPETLRIVFHEKVFNGLNVNEATSAFRFLAQTVGRKMGYEIATDIVVPRSEPAYREALRTSEFDLVVINPWVLFSEALEQKIRPELVVDDGEGTAKRFLVVTRSDSSLTNLASLQGRNLVTLNNGFADVGVFWLDSLLDGSGLGAREGFFGTYETAAKPAHVVLPLFFGKKDAAIVDAGSLKVMVELNPQVGRVVRPILSSEPMSNPLIAFRSSPWRSDDFRKDIVDAMARFEEDPEGRQVLLLFKIKRLTRLPEGLLDNVRALHAARSAASPQRGK